MDKKNRKKRTRINKKIFAYPHIVHGKQTNGKVVKIVKKMSNGYIYYPISLIKIIEITIISIKTFPKKTIPLDNFPFCRSS